LHSSVPRTPTTALARLPQDDTLLARVPRVKARLPRVARLPQAGELLRQALRRARGLRRVGLAAVEQHVHHPVPILVVVRLLAIVVHDGLHRGVAAQVDPLGKQTLKPGYHISGSRVETGRFQAVGRLHSTCTAPPWRSAGCAPEG
jgi:hypothetical protein